MQKNWMIAISLLVLAIFACDETGQLPAATPPPEESFKHLEIAPLGESLLGIDINPAEDGDYDTAVALAKDAGAQVVSLSVFWDEIETDPGVYEPNPNWLAIANQYYPAQGMEVALVISVVDTNQNRLPGDLQDRRFDDPEVLSRFKGLLDYIFAQIPDLELVSLSIGNEVDIFLGSDVRGWEQYEGFYQAASDYVHVLRPGLPVGVKATHSGLTGDLRDHLKTLNRTSDVILVTYYPLKNDFTVKDPSVVANDFRVLTNQYPGKRIFFHETGFPSGVKCNSSEQKQAMFIEQVFAAWDTHSDQIGLVIFTWLTDVSPDAVREMEAYYGLSDPVFLEYLGTLGLRTYSGSGASKAAFLALKREVQKRSEK